MPEGVIQTIPESITVHLGTPESGAKNVTLPFADYVKNVTSSEIYPSWPENALRANIYAITTYALNRIYTEWYPSRGYDFDITSSTRYDQAFVEGRDIFENVSILVDELFNDYVVRQGTVNPLFTQFCNGTTSTCNGLSQWGTVELANQGLNPYEILQRYYGEDISIINNAPVQNIPDSYPGTPLRLGDSGNDVKILQDELNRISRNYPAIPKIPDPKGVFGTATEEAVRAFQRIFDLPETGEVDKATWYRIKRYYVGVKALSELISEGVSLQEAELPYEGLLQEGSFGTPVRLIQYYLSVIAYFNEGLEIIPISGVYDGVTADAVRVFQRYYGLSPDGIVGRLTWNKLQEVYREVVGSVPDSVYGDRARLYPGYVLSEGMRGKDVTELQSYLSFIAEFYNDLPPLPVTGYFGSQTNNAVQTFQRLFGLEPNGAVGAVTWNEIAKQYDFLKETEG